MKFLSYKEVYKKLSDITIKYIATSIYFLCEQIFSESIAIKRKTVGHGFISGNVSICL